MSRIATTTTLVPPLPDFPYFAEAPMPHHILLAPRGQGSTRLNDIRDLSRELDDLSEEENELDEVRNELKTRGSTWIIPIGKQQTLQEEKNDASSEPSEAGSMSNGPVSEAGDNERDSVVDLDANMADLDDFDNDVEGFNPDDVVVTNGDTEADTGNVSAEEMQE